MSRLSITTSRLLVVIPLPSQNSLNSLDVLFKVKLAIFIAHRRCCVLHTKSMIWVLTYGRVVRPGALQSNPFADCDELLESKAVVSVIDRVEKVIEVVVAKLLGCSSSRYTDQKVVHCLLSEVVQYVAKKSLWEETKGTLLSPIWSPSCWAKNEQRRTRLGRELWKGRKWTRSSNIWHQRLENKDNNKGDRTTTRQNNASLEAFLVLVVHRTMSMALFMIRE